MHFLRLGDEEKAGGGCWLEEEKTDEQEESDSRRETDRQGPLLYRGPGIYNTLFRELEL